MTIAAEGLAQSVPAGPGVAGQQHAAAYDPLDADTIYVGSDVAGVLVTHDHGLSWVPWNEGLGNTEWAATEYVDGLAAIKSNTTGYVVPPGRQGVYAATHGGIYFRPSGGIWQLQTNYAANDTFRYSGTFLTNSPGVSELHAPVPFSCLVFDESNGVLYAGAGHGRWYDSAAAWDAFYPDSGATSGTWSLWRCNLSATGDGLWHPITATQNLGKVRQIAILGVGSTARPVFASSKGVFAPDADGSQYENIWTMRDKSLEPGIPWSGNAWGVGAGKDGALYCVMAATFETDQNAITRVSNPNVYVIDSSDPEASWRPLAAGSDPVYPNTGASADTWGEIVNNSNSDLMRLTVVPGSPTEPDAVYVGERHSSVNSGYFRYGSYFAPAGLDTGWVHLLYLTNSSGGPLVWDDIKYHSVNLFTNPVTVSDLPDVGWASNYTITPTIPLLICPTQPDRMFAFAYHLPLAFDSPATGWQQRNCTGSGTGPDGFWSSNGLNMMSVTDLGFTPSRKLIVGSRDFGVVATPDGVRDEFQWLNWYADGGKNVFDVEALAQRAERPESILAVRAAPRKWIQGHGYSTFGFTNEFVNGKWDGTRQKYVLAAYDESVVGAPADSNGFRWRYLSRDLDSAFDGLGSTSYFEVVDVEVVDSTTVFVALTKDLTGDQANYASRVYKGTIGADWNVTWAPWWGVDSYCQAVELKHLSRAGKILVAASRDNGGVFCLDVDNSAMSEQWLSASDPTVDARLELTLRYLTCIAVDRLERVVYVGTRGEYTYMPGTRSIGAVLRLTLPSGRSPVASDWAMVANSVGSNSFGFVAPSAPGFWPWPTEDPQDRLTDVQTVAVDPGNPYVIYAGLRQGGVRSMGTFAPTNGAWKFTPNGASGTWIRVFPAGEAAGPSAGVSSLALDPVQSTRMVVGTYGQELYSLTIVPSSHPIIASAAVHPLLAAISDSVQVLTVQIAADTTLVAVEADLGGLGLPGEELILLDDGEGEDLAEGDGVFTSPRFPALLTAGTGYTVRVFAQDATGGYDEQEVAVEVVASKTHFEDLTKFTGDLAGILTEQPYSAVYFKSRPGDPESEDIMIVTFDNVGSLGVGQQPQILQRSALVNGAPQFALKTSSWIAYGGLPRGARGVSYADFDNDGDNDFFLCNPASGGRLYRSYFAQGMQVFTNATDTIFGADAAHLSQAIAASWGDYNADGYADLFVAGTNYFNSVQALATDGFGSGGSSGITYSGWIFRNRGGDAFTKTLWGSQSQSNVLLGACWADLDNDGDLDQITAKYIGGPIQVLENTGFYYPLGDNLMGVTGWGIPLSDPDWVYGANSVTVFDYDHDAYPDLVVTFATHDGNPKVKILRNNFGTGSRVFTPIDVASGTEWNGATVADFDLDGQDDILLHPRASGVAPGLYLADGYDTSATYRDLGFTAGLRGGSTGGAVAVDFDQERNIDLYLGRGEGNDRGALYRNAGQAAASNAWLEVRPRTVSGGYGSLVGTKVIVEAQGRRWQKTVEGGGGRGGQGANQLLFGLGDVTGDVSVTVRFPSGEVDGPVTVSPNGAAYEAWEDQAVALLTPPPKQNLTYDYEFGPGTADWIFRWRTDARRGDPARDRVEIWNYSNYNADGDCGVGIAPGQIRMLAPGDPEVEHLVYLIGDKWYHELRWLALPCGNNCQYKFRVTSGLGSQSQTSNWVNMSTSTFCVADPGDPNQQ